MYTSDAKPNDDIQHGSAIVCGTKTGWILPGGRIVHSMAQARMYAIRMNRIMTRGEV